MYKIHSFMDSSSPSPLDVETMYAVEEEDVFSGISLKKINVESVLNRTQSKNQIL